MKRCVESECREQSTLFPETLDNYIGEDNPVRVIDVFVDQLHLEAKEKLSIVRRFGGHFRSIEFVGELSPIIVGKCRMKTTFD